jgi:hypothetical protein
VNEALFSEKFAKLAKISPQKSKIQRFYDRFPENFVVKNVVKCRKKVARYGFLDKATVFL